MKVIFLDHDGVICLASNWGSRFKKQAKDKSLGKTSLPVEYRFDNFDKKAIKLLNDILVETGAEIVVSSDWRSFATLEEMGEYYLMQGVVKKPLDYTKSILGSNYRDFPWNRNADREQTRSLEILEWLEKHPEVTHWVAVDDLHMGVHVEHSWRGEYTREGWGLTNFVYTPFGREGIKQVGVKEKILKYLL